eukprot:g10896.t1
MGGGGVEDGGNGSAGSDDLGGADDESAGPQPCEDTGGDNDIENLMGRIEATVEMSGRDADAGEHSVEGVEWDIGVDDEGYDDFQGDIDNGGGPQQPDDETFLPPEYDGYTSSATPRIEGLHTMAPSFASCTTVEGGPEELRHNTKASKSPFYPFFTKEQQLIFIWLHVHRISQRAFAGLLEVLSTVYEGEPFDVKGLAGVNPEHFYSRMRPYLPLLQLVKRDVPSAHDKTASSAVFDIPVNLLLHRTMQIESETALSDTHPGGKLLRGEEIEANCLTSEHINCVPTRREGNVMNSNHNGALAKSTPFFGFDGIRARVCGRKVFVNDCCACDVGGEVTLCRLLEIFYDEVRRLVLVTLRLFRTVAEMRDVGEEERRGGLLRVWEDCTPSSHMELEATNVLGLVEMESPQNPNGDGEHSFPWDRYHAEGFATAAGNKRRHQRDAMLKPFKVLESPWHAEGPADKPLFGLRHQGVHLNDMNLPFYSAPVVFSCDAFNAWGLGNKRDDETGGDLGNPQFDIEKHRRHWGQMMEGFSELEALEDDPHGQEERSKELGLAAPDASGLKLPLYHAMRIVPTEHLPVERLHFDALLKDILTDYPSLTGSDKWTLQSIMLLVFRVVLQDVSSMRKNMKKRDVKALRAEWGTYDSVLGALRTLIQMVSLLSFALRAPSYNDEELRQLDSLARDAVGAFAQIMGRTGSRPTIHSMLHTVEAIRLHGVCPDASTGEHAHQMNKSGKAVDCGRMPSLHMAKRANVNSAILALSNGLPYRVTKYNRRSKAHEIISVKPGAGCVRLMQSLASFLGHDRVPTDIRAEAIQSPAQLRGQFPGSAVWAASLFNAGDEQQNDGGWLSRVVTSKFRPDAGTLLDGYFKYYACDMAGECSSSRCPNCWSGDALETVNIEYSRYLRVPMVASCGLGRLKGGDVKSADQPGPRDDWALGNGGGESVEVHRQPSTMGEAGRVEPRDLSIVKKKLVSECGASCGGVKGML